MEKVDDGAVKAVLETEVENEDDAEFAADLILEIAVEIESEKLGGAR